MVSVFRYNSGYGLEVNGCKGLYEFGPMSVHTQIIWLVSFSLHHSQYHPVQPDNNLDNEEGRDQGYYSTCKRPGLLYSFNQGISPHMGEWRLTSG